MVAEDSYTFFLVMLRLLLGDNAYSQASNLSQFLVLACTLSPLQLSSHPLNQLSSHLGLHFEKMEMTFYLVDQ